MAPLRDRLELALKLGDSAFDALGKILGDPTFSDELCEHLSRLLQILRRLVPESPVVSEEIRDMPCVDGLPIAIRLFLHVVAEEGHEQIHEILPTNAVDLQLFEDQVSDRNRRVVEFEPPGPRFLPEQDIVAELELVEEDIDVESIAALVVDEPPIAEEPVDHVVGPEAQAIEHLADRAALGCVPDQIEVREEGGPLSHPSHAAVETDTFGSVERVCVDGEGAENPKDSALRSSRIDDRPGFPEELVIAEGHERGWICHDCTEESMRPSKGPSPRRGTVSGPVCEAAIRGSL